MATINQVLKKCRKIKHKRKFRLLALEGCPQKRGVCVKVKTTKPKKPNSAIRKIAKVRLSNNKIITAYIPGQGHNLQEHSVVIVRGGRTPDVPGLKYKLVRGKLDFSYVERFVRKKSCSKYGYPNLKKD